MAGYTAFTKNGASLSSVHKKERLFLCILTNFEKIKNRRYILGIRALFIV